MAGCGRESTSCRAVAADAREHPGHPHRGVRRAGWRERRGLSFGDPTDYDALWRWSVEHLDQFWGDVAALDRRAARRPGRPGADPTASMPGAEWFPGTTVNYAEQALRQRTADHPALIAAPRTPSRSRSPGRRCAGRSARSPPRCAGWACGPGDRVAGYLPNVPEAVVAFLGAAVDRRGVVVLRAGLRHPRRPRPVRPDRAHRAGRRRRLPVQRQGVRPARRRRRAAGGPAQRADDDRRPPAVPGRAARRRAGLGRGRRRRAGAGVRADCPSTTRCGSSTRPGTTGLPKGIVHGHGGVVLEQRKQAALHMDVGVGDRFFWYASTAWIMWNIATSALLVGAHGGGLRRRTGVPDGRRPVRPRRAHRHDLPGHEPRLPRAPARRPGVRPGEQHDLSALRGVGSTGSPLPVGDVPLGLRRGEGRRAASARCRAAPTSPPASSAARRCCR